MLNTDLHNANIKPERKMKLSDFIRNLRGQFVHFAYDSLYCLVTLNIKQQLIIFVCHWSFIRQSIQLYLCEWNMDFCYSVDLLCFIYMVTLPLLINCKKSYFTILAIYGIDISTYVIN